MAMWCLEIFGAVLYQNLLQIPLNLVYIVTYEGFNELTCKTEFEI